MRLLKITKRFRHQRMLFSCSVWLSHRGERDNEHEEWKSSPSVNNKYRRVSRPSHGIGAGAGASRMQPIILIDYLIIEPIW